MSVRLVVDGPIVDATDRSARRHIVEGALTTVGQILLLCILHKLGQKGGVTYVQLIEPLLQNLLQKHFYGLK